MYNSSYLPTKINAERYIYLRNKRHTVFMEVLISANIKCAISILRYRKRNNLGEIHDSARNLCGTVQLF